LNCRFNRLAWIAAALLCLATIIVWLPTIRFGFVYDDRGQILENPQLQSWAYLGKFFHEHTWAHLSWMPASFYRPLFLVWLRANYALFGNEPAGWHLASVLLHGIATASFFVLAFQLLRDWKPGAIAAAIFGLHPAHAESVAWISGSTDLLAAVFLFASIYCFLRARGHSFHWLIVALTLYGCALLSKETAMVGLLIVVFLALETRESAPGPHRVLQVAPFAALTLIYLLVRQEVLGKVIATASHTSLATSLWTAPSLALFYARHLLWPARLSGFYDFPLVESPRLRSFVVPSLALMVTLALIVSFVRSVRHSAPRPAIFMALLLLLAPLLPAFHLAALEPGNFVHDRYLYLPVAGFALLMAIAFHSLSQQAMRLAPVLYVILCGLLFSYAFADVRESRIWTNDMSLFSRAAEVAPENLVAKVNLAGELIRQQRCGDAVPLLEQVVQRRPEMWFAHANLANCYLEAGQKAQAERELSIAVQLQPLPELVRRLQMLRTPR
jgi:hypothetical protein